MFGFPDHGFCRAYPKVMAMLQDHGGLIFEVPTLVKFPQHVGGVLYQKGLALDLVEPDLVHVGALMVRHPGQEIDAAGVNRGWCHRVGEDGVWRRETRDDEYLCGNDWPHKRHMASL